MGIFFTEAERIRLKLLAKGRQIVLAAPQLYIDVDIETDGWAGHGSMLSLGAVAPDGQMFYAKIRPLYADYVPSQREFCETHGLERERLLAEGSHYAETMRNFQSWVLRLAAQSGKRPVFTAFNAAFDFGFVQLYFLKAGLTNPFESAPLDLKSLAMVIDANWDWSLTAKNQWPAEMRPDGDFVHDALEDAIYQQKMHFAMAGAIAELHGRLDEYLSSPASG